MPTAVTTLAEGEDAHRWPHFLPDGRHFFYNAVTGACCPPQRRARSRLARSIRPSLPSRCFEADSSATYASGHLLFARDETLMAQAFDPDDQSAGRRCRSRDRFVSARRAVVMSAHPSRRTGRSSTRPAAHRIHTQLIWFDRAGTTLGTLGDGGLDVNLSLSPDENQVAVALRTGSPENLDIWTIEIARNLRNRVTTDRATPRMAGVVAGWHAHRVRNRRASGWRDCRRRRLSFRLWPTEPGRMKRSSKPRAHLHGHVARGNAD